MSLVKLYFAADLRLFPEYNNYSDIKIYKKGPDRVSYPFSEFVQCLWFAWERGHHNHNWVSANPPFTNPAYGPEVSLSKSLLYIYMYVVIVPNSCVWDSWNSAWVPHFL